MPIITDIITVRDRPQARCLVIDDEHWQVVPFSVLKEMKLALGNEIQLDSLEASIHTISERLAFRRAVQLITYRERCSAELSVRLISEGYDDSIVNDVLEQLKKKDLLDDIDCADNYARNLILTKSFGRSRALRAMTVRGFEEKHTYAALDKWAPWEHEEERATLCARKVVRPGDSIESLTRRLVRKGYSVSVSLHTAQGFLGVTQGE